MNNAGELKCLVYLKRTNDKGLMILTSSGVTASFFKEILALRFLIKMVCPLELFCRFVYEVSANVMKSIMKDNLEVKLKHLKEQNRVVRLFK